MGTSGPDLGPVRVRARWNHVLSGPGWEPGSITAVPVSAIMCNTRVDPLRPSRDQIALIMPAQNKALIMPAQNKANQRVITQTEI